MYNVTIPAGKTSANFTVTIIDDAILEEEELFSLALSILPFPTSLGIHSASSVAIVTVTDDDPLSVQFAESNYSVSEGAGEVVLNLTANGTSAVNYTVVVVTMDGSGTGEHSVSVKQCSTSEQPFFRYFESCFYLLRQCSSHFVPYFLYSLSNKHSHTDTTLLQHTIYCKGSYSVSCLINFV